MDKPTIRCSELDRVLRCGGSLKLCSLIVDQRGTDWVQGVIGHHEIASKLCSGPLPWPEQIKPGEKFAEPWAIDWCIRRANEFIDYPHRMVEHALAYEFDRYNLSGHIDYLGISTDAKQAALIDWKLGRRPTDPADSNDQVAGYIVLTKRAWPSLDVIRAAIGQPFNNEDAGFPRFSVVEVGGSDLDDLMESMDDRINGALDKGDELSRSVIGCKYCSAFAQCEEIKLLRKRMKTKLTPAMLAEIQSETPDAELADIVLDWRTLKGPMEAIDTVVRGKIKKGGPIVANSGARLSLETKNGQWKAVNKHELFKAVKDVLPEERMANAITFSVGELVEQIAEEKGIPETSSEGLCARDVFDGYMAPHMQQGTQYVLRISQ